MFWRFFLGLLVLSFVFPKACALLCLPFIGVITLALGVREKAGRTTVLSRVLVATGFVGNTYVFLGWSAFCASVVLLFVEKPEVHHSWLYYVLGFFFCNSPLAFMALHEAPGSRGVGLQMGSAMVAYVAFCVYPTLMWPWGWIPYVS